MRTATMIALASFALSSPIGCAGLSAQQTQSVWVYKDGSPAPPGVAERAEVACDRAVTAEATERPARQQMSIEWAAAKRQCMADMGLVLTTQPAQ
jgi:hypothetical protein